MIATVVVLYGLKLSAIVTFPDFSGSTCGKVGVYVNVLNDHNLKVVSMGFDVKNVEAGMTFSLLVSYFFCPFF